MVTETLPITYRTDPRLFQSPINREMELRELDQGSFRAFCAQSAVPQGRAHSDSEIKEVEESYRLDINLAGDFNKDGLPDRLLGFQEISHPYALRLFLEDGREATEWDEAVYSPKDLPEPMSELRALTRDSDPGGPFMSRICVKDVNGDGYDDILWEEISRGGTRHRALINQKPLWEREPLSPQGWASLERRQAIEFFVDDWKYLTRRLAFYKKKYGKEVTPSLIAETDKDKRFWHLQFTVGGETFDVSRFPDPTENGYELGMLMGGKDPEEFLNDRIEPERWVLAARFGAFTPYTFQVGGESAPIGFVVGAEAMYAWRHLALVLEYDHGLVGVFPEALREIESGDPVDELPINEPVPIKLKFDNGSALALAHRTFHSRHIVLDVMGGAGPFYEHGVVTKKKFEINLGDLSVDVEKSRESYHALGPRGRIGGAMEVGHFHAGIGVIVDLGLPLDGDFENFDDYLLRGMLYLALGFKGGRSRSDRRR